ncbi:site-specific integrase [Halorhabdus sp. CUG00001]|uniref:tyrosine-type recombinase/integrase n=1 Tax=Halorhabdus sp. CUG00001 TaxID=2600297 RepID=UPI00131B6B49|nr:site-specific integrase [Halorhabdus sp. CUG00001]
MTEDDLEPIAPQDILDWYLEHRRDDLRTSTRRKHRSALGTFVDWTDEAGIENMNDIGGRQLMEFKTWRKTETDLVTVSLNGNLAILQRFLRFCENIDAIADGVADRVPLPNVPPEEEVNYEVPSDEEVREIQTYCRRFEYTSRRHVEFELIAEIGVRLGAVRAIDMDDFDPDEKVIHLRHRPESTDEYGTPLKNGPDGERIVNLSDRLRDYIVAYIDQKRTDVRDKFDRKPLFTTSSGRPSTATIRRDFYKLSRPCTYANSCPHDRDITDCDAAQNANAADCPSRFSTHPLRKWAIMRQLNEGVPKELLSDRVDVSTPVLDKHYDQRTKAKKSRRRREVLEANLTEYAMADGGQHIEDGDE